MRIIIEERAAKDFFKKTASFDPDDRINAHQCLHHCWLDSKAKISNPITLKDMIVCHTG